jgi:glycine cleavage system H lipoate-binding protein
LNWLSDDPFGKGWIMQVRLSDPSQLDALMSQDEYARFCDSEKH